MRLGLVWYQWETKSKRQLKFKAMNTKPLALLAFLISQASYAQSLNLTCSWEVIGNGNWKPIGNPEMRKPFGMTMTAETLRFNGDVYHYRNQTPDGDRLKNKGPDGSRLSHYWRSDSSFDYIATVANRGSGIPPMLVLALFPKDRKKGDYSNVVRWGGQCH